MPLNLPLSCEIVDVDKGGFGPLTCRGDRYPHISDMQFQIVYLLPTTWPDMVEFRSASSEIRRRIKKKEERKKELEKVAIMATYCHLIYCHAIAFPS